MKTILKASTLLAALLMSSTLALAKSAEIEQSLYAYDFMVDLGSHYQSDTKAGRKEIEQFKKDHYCAASFWNSLKNVESDPEIRESMGKIANGLKAKNVRLVGRFAETPTGDSRAWIELEIRGANMNSGKSSTLDRYKLPAPKFEIHAGSNGSKISCAAARPVIAKQILAIPAREAATLAEIIGHINRGDIVEEGKSNLPAYKKDRQQYQDLAAKLLATDSKSVSMSKATKPILETNKEQLPQSVGVSKNAR